MKWIFNLALLTLVFTQSAFAGQGTCSSADQRVSFTYSYSDGGAFFKPAYFIKLDGATVYQDGPQFEQAKVALEYQEGERTNILSTPMTAKSPQIDVYAEKLTLTDPSTGSKRFDDYVLCRVVSRPCPNCP